MSQSRRIFVAGGTGYIGRAVIPRLLERGHAVFALVRPGSEGKLPAGATPVPGDALRKETFASAVSPCDTLLQLVGVAHPSPSKAEQFRRVDLASAQASAQAARDAHVAHFVYLSVAQPAPAMKAYVAARAAAEAFIRAAGLNATFLRPWYVLGPGHRWPVVLHPGYWLAERIAPIAATARRIGLVTLSQMVAAIVGAIEHPPSGVRVIEVPQIRSARL
jgi:uncharacterized protein YbjT (DUF2867 family)